MVSNNRYLPSNHHVLCIYGTTIEFSVLAIKIRHRINSLAQMKYMNLNWLRFDASHCSTLQLPELRA